MLSHISKQFENEKNWIVIEFIPNYDIYSFLIMIFILLIIKLICYNNIAKLPQNKKYG